MKKLIILFSIIFFSSGCCTFRGLDIGDRFLTAFPSENNKIQGELYLDVFNNNLDTLTYEYYMHYFSDKEKTTPSIEGIMCTVKKADQHYFKTKKNAFLILLFYSGEKEIIGDNSHTAFIDTVIKLHQNDTIPSLEAVAAKMRF
jgi:hypothetical protein